MSLFDKLFGRKHNEENEIDEKEYEEDEIFVNKFKDSGGIFFYCESQQMGLEYLQKIFINEDISEVLCISDELAPILTVLDCNYNMELNNNQDIAFINCEYLIVADGSIMVSSNNIKSYKKETLPSKIVVWATPGQIVESASKALAKIKSSKDKIPSNITSFQGKLADFSDQNNSKQLYLLLVEDTHI